MVRSIRNFKFNFAACFAALIFFSTFMPSPVHAQEQSSGAALITKIIQSSEKPESQPKGISWLLGNVYFDRGIRLFNQQNHADAANWFLKAANKGNIKAYAILGIMYVDGLGVPQDHTKAMKWYRKASEHNYAKAETVFRVTESIAASTSARGNAASACITFTLPLKGSKRFRYNDYVNVKPASRDLVITVRNGKLCIDGLSFGEEYEVSLLPGLPSADAIPTIIGEEFSVLTSNREPVISFREQGYILPSYGPQIIPLESVNVQKAKIGVLRIVERNLISQVKSGFLNSLSARDIKRVLENEGDLVFEGTVEFPDRLNKSVVSGLKVEDLIGRKLDVGIYIVVAGKMLQDASKWRPEITQWLVVSDIGASLFRGPDGLHVLTRSLNSAEPLAGVTVSLVAKNNRELAHSVSDSRGYTHFSAPLMNGAGGNEPIFVRTESSDGGFSFVSLKQKAFDLRDRGVAGREPPGPIEAYVSTERGIYRPGETVHLTALIRDDQGRAVEGNVPMTLRLIRPDGVEVDRRVLQDSGGSSYIDRLSIDPSAHSGEWTAHIYLNPKGEPIGSVNFQVADFVPPQIEVKAEGTLVPRKQGAKVSVAVSSNYFFGAPAGGLRVTAKARIYAQRTPYKEREGFFFGLEEETFDPIMVKFEDGKLEAEGKTTLSTSLMEYPDVTVPLDIEIWARVFELGGRARMAKVVMPLNNLEMAIGIRPLFDKGRIANGAEAKFEVVTLDRNGGPIDTGNLEYTLYKERRDYTWFRRSGSWDYEVFITDEAVRTETLAVFKNSLGNIDLNVEWGAYRLEVRDNKSGAASSYRFYSGWGGSVSGPDRPDSLSIKLDAKKYRFGDTAKAFISPPFPGQLVLVVAGKNLEFIPAGEITREGKSVEIPIKDRWAAEPGVYVMPIVFRPGVQEKEQQSGRAFGVAWLGMDLSDRRLDLSLNSPEEVRPGQRLMVQVAAKNFDSETLIRIAAVDDGVLGLTNYKTPDPFSHVFARRRLAYEIRDTYGYLINPYGTERSIIQSGGDSAAGRLDRGLSTRTTKVVSLVSKIVHANSDGKAEVSFDVPQFSGRLRIMAVAWNGNQLGSAEKKVQVRDPLVANLVLPRFLAPGDRALATASFNNVSGEAGTYEVIFSTDGPVELDGESSWSMDLGAKENFTAAVPLVGGGIGTARIAMRVRGPGSFLVDKTWDITVRAIQPITIARTFARLEKGDEKTLSADLLRSYLEGTGSVTLSVGSIPSFGVQALLDDMLIYPYRCLEQTTSRAMAFLFGTGQYPSDGKVKEFPEKFAEEINAAISRLTTLQRRDGSFGLWSSSDSREEWLTAYATDFLVRAREAGFRVPEGLYRNALNWLRSSVRSGYYNTYQTRPVAYAHYVLARAGRGDVGRLRQFFDTYREKFPTSMESAFIASALDSYGDRERAEQALKDILMKRGGTGSDYYSSPVRQVAALLHLTAETGSKTNGLDQSAFLFAKKLAAMKHFSTQESAWISMAAVSIEAWARNYQVKVDGQLWQGPEPTRFKLKASRLKQGFSVTNVGDKDAVFEITVRGIKGTTLPAEKNGLSIKREFIGEDGKEVSLADVKQGDPILVRLSGKVADDSGPLQALVVDLLPAGLEIESTRFDESILGMPENTSWKKSRTLFVNGRDDRYVAAVKLTGGDEFGLQYLARAVTPGSYALPAPYVENMYRPDQFARGQAFQLVIHQ